MQTIQKLAHLKAMGIEVWRDRWAEPSQALSYHYLPLKNKLVILADQDPDLHAEEQVLLQAISKALGVETKPLDLASQELAGLLSGPTLILMGDIIAEAFAGKKFIHTYAPSQLLKTPQLKAKTWEAIRHLKISENS